MNNCYANSLTLVRALPSARAIGCTRCLPLSLTQKPFKVQNSLFNILQFEKKMNLEQRIMNFEI